MIGLEKNRIVHWGIVFCRNFFIEIAVVLLWIVLVYGGYSFVHKNKTTDQEKKEIFLVQRMDVLSNECINSGNYSFKVYFISNKEELVEQIQAGDKVGVSSKEVVLKGKIKKVEVNTNYLLVGGTQYFIRACQLTLYGFQRKMNYEELTLQIIVNGDSYHMPFGNLYCMPEEQGEANSSIQVSLLASYGKVEDSYDTSGIIVGLEAKEDLTIVQYDSVCTAYKPSLEQTIVLEGKEAQQLTGQIEYTMDIYPNAYYSKEKNKGQKEIVVKSGDKKTLIIPLQVNSSIPLQSYGFSIMYRKKGTIYKKNIYYGVIKSILSVNSDLLEKMVFFSPCCTPVSWNTH